MKRDFFFFNTQNVLYELKNRFGKKRSFLRAIFNGFYTTRGDRKFPGEKQKVFEVKGNWIFFVKA